MMRFAPVKALPSYLVAAGVRPSQFKFLNRPLVNAINAAYDQAVARGPAYRRWFGGAAANRGVILANMQRMRDFANGHAELSLVLKETAEAGQTSNAYAYGQRGRAITHGSYIVYLGRTLGLVYSSPALTLRNNTMAGQCLQVIAHELSHMVFGANFSPPAPRAYEVECYQDDALVLADADPRWASYNAENYGYFIEQCAVI